MSWGYRIEINCGTSRNGCEPWREYAVRGNRHMGPGHHLHLIDESKLMNVQKENRKE